MRPVVSVCERMQQVEFDIGWLKLSTVEEKKSNQTGIYMVSSIGHQREADIQ